MTQANKIRELEERVRELELELEAAYRNHDRVIQELLPHIVTWRGQARQRAYDREREARAE